MKRHDHGFLSIELRTFANSFLHFLSFYLCSLQVYCKRASESSRQRTTCFYRSVQGFNSLYHCLKIKRPAALFYDYYKDTRESGVFSEFFLPLQVLVTENGYGYVLNPIKTMQSDILDMHVEWQDQDLQLMLKNTKTM